MAAAFFLVLASGCSKKSSKEPTQQGGTNTTNSGGQGGSETSGTQSASEITVNHLPQQAKMVMALQLDRMFTKADLDPLFEQGVQFLMLQAKDDPTEAAEAKAALAIIKGAGVNLSSLKAFYFAQGDFKGEAVGILVTDVDIKKILETFLAAEAVGKEVKKTPEVVDGMEIWVNGEKSAMTIYKNKTLLIADNVEDLKLVIASVQGKGPTIKENKDLQELLSKCAKSSALMVAGSPEEDEPSDVKRLAMTLSQSGKGSVMELYVVPQAGEMEKMKQGAQMLSAMKPMLKTQLDRQFAPVAPMIGAESADTLRTFYTQLVDSLSVDVSDGKGMWVKTKTTVPMSKLMALSTKLGAGYFAHEQSP